MGGLLDDIGDGFSKGLGAVEDGLNKGLGAVEDGIDSGKKALGEGVDWTTDRVGEGLDQVGAEGAADAVEDWGDSVASDLGATPGEQQLGETEDANELVHGNPARIRESGKHLRDFQAAFDKVGQGMRKVDSTEWKGEGGDAFREKFGVHPQKWLHAADACGAADKALAAYADTVKWAQDQAREAIELYKKGRKTSEDAVAAYNSRVDAFNARLKADQDPGPRPEPFSDPGKADLEKAAEQLAGARRQRNTAATTAGASVQQALAHAPAEPPPLDRLGSNVVDGTKALSTELTHVAGGAIKGTAGLLNFARGLNPTDPYNLTHPAEYLRNVSMTLSGLVSTAAHPERIVTAAVDGFTKDPSEFIGRLLPELVGTKGAGLARGALTTGIKATAKDALEHGLGDAAKNGARRAAGEHPQATSRQPADKTCERDPVDVATGRVVLPQRDVSLSGALPLVFSRSFESSCRTGRWFGPSWSSTADQRLETDAEGVVFVGEDGLLLTFPHPAPGVPTLPDHGPRQSLDREEGGYVLTDPRTGHIRHFTDVGEGLSLLEQIEDRNGNRITFEYDEHGAPRSVVHSGGYHLKLTTAHGRVVALQLAGAAPDGGDQELLRYDYSPEGHLVGVTNSCGRPTRFGYDGLGRVESWTDTNGSHFTYAYDDEHRCVHQSGADGHQRSAFAYGPADPATGEHTTTITDSLGHTTSYLINERAQVIAATDALGRTTRFTRDRHHRLLSRTDALGHSTFFHYDDGRLTRVVRPDGREARAEYNTLGLPVKVTDPDGTVRHQEYDDRGNRTRITTPGGNSTDFGYDEAGRLVSVTDALGHTTTLRNDGAGLPVEITDPLGAVTRYERDAFGRPVVLTDALGATTRLEWTVESLPARRTAPDGSQESWVHDGEGNCVKHTDPAGAVTRFEYTHFDLLAARTEPDGVRHVFTHDTELRLTEVANPRGMSWNYRYDPAGRLVSESDFDGRTTTYSHDAVGTLASRVTPLGETITFERNALGQVVRKDAAGAVTSYTYDLTDQLAEVNGPALSHTLLRDKAGLLRSETVNGRTTTYAYDGLGRRTARTTPSGARSNWTYDPAGNRVELTTSGRTLAFRHDVTGREVSRQVGDGLTLSHAFDPLGRLTAQSLTTGDERVLSHRAYTYRPDGNLTGVDDLLSGAQHYDLDARGRVTAVHAANWAESYAYDADGNQTHADWPAEHPGHEATGPREYSGTRLTRAGAVHYTHDAAGRIVQRRKTRLSRKPDVWEYTWDAEDRLTAVTRPDGTRWRYRYDASGRRIAKQRLASDALTVLEHTDFTWDGTTLCEQTTISDQLPHPVTLTWDYEGIRPVAQTERICPADAPQEEIDSRFFAIVTDLIGTPTELVDERGDIAWRSRRSLWGSTTWASDSTAYTPLRFPGQYYDPETGLHYNYLRHYDPETARYLTPDPLGLTPAPNPCGYVRNPHTWTDPLGLSPCPPHLFRGTTRGFEGSPGVQRHGITPTSSDPGVATVFATQAERFGDAVVEIYPPGALDGVPVHQGYIAREAEWPVELSPAELSSRASVQVPSSVAREILSEMGIDVPRRISNGDIDPLLEYDVAKLTPEQIAKFVEEAHRRA